MRRSGTGSGGGFGSRNVKHVTAPKVEPKPYAKRPAGAAAIGTSYGDHVTHRGNSTGYTGERLDRGRGYAPPQGPTNMALAGPGAGREVMRSGGQAMHGAANPGNAPAKGRDILREFGPDYRKP
jgi:hypothetical protein